MNPRLWFWRLPRLLIFVLAVGCTDSASVPGQDSDAGLDVPLDGPDGEVGDLSSEEVPPDDRDDDGLDDLREAALGTDPDHPDTDRDGLMDYQEVERLGTDPLSRDSDGDGLSDGEEVQSVGSDPLRRDSDDDGFGDRREWVTGTNPMASDSDGDGVGANGDCDDYSWLYRLF